MEPEGTGQDSPKSELSQSTAAAKLEALIVPKRAELYFIEERVGLCVRNYQERGIHTLLGARYALGGEYLSMVNSAFEELSHIDKEEYFLGTFKPLVEYLQVTKLFFELLLEPKNSVPLEEKEREAIQRQWELQVELCGERGPELSLAICLESHGGLRIRENVERFFQAPGRAAVERLVERGELGVASRILTLLGPAFKPPRSMLHTELKYFPFERSHVGRPTAERQLARTIEFEDTILPRRLENTYKQLRRYSESEQKEAARFYGDNRQ